MKSDTKATTSGGLLIEYHLDIEQHIAIRSECQKITSSLSCQTPCLAKISVFVDLENQLGLL